MIALLIILYATCANVICGFHIYPSCQSRGRSTLVHLSASVESMIVPFLPPPENDDDSPSGWTKPRPQISVYRPKAPPVGRDVVFLGGYIVSSFPTYFYRQFVEFIAESTSRSIVCLQYDNFSDGGTGFGNHRKSAENALKCCQDLGLVEADIVAHSLGCKIATIMRDEGFGGDDCKCVYVSPNNQELDGSLDYVLGVLRKLGGTDDAERAERALGSLRMLLKGVGGFLKFNPDRETFWDISRRVFRDRKGNLKMISLEGEGEEGLDEAFEWVMEIGKEGGGGGGEEGRLLEGVFDMDVQEGGDGSIVVAKGTGSGESISVDILDYPHLSPCYFDLTSQFNRAAATNFDNFGKVGKLEVVEEIAKKVSEFYG